MGPQIPQELCEFFIDYLHDDTRALSACSLTCRAWLLTARYHRFHAIIISYDYGRWYHLQELLVANPYLAPLIQSLRINHTTGIQTTRNQPPVFTVLPSLKELMLDNVMPDDVLFSTLVQTAGSSTRHLVINDGHFRHLDDVLKIIASFPRLETVHMSVKNIASRSAQMGNKHGNVPMLPTPPTSIRRITFGSHIFELADQFIFDWLYLGNIRIDSLTYRVSFKIHSDLLHHMLTKVKDTLEHLCLVIDVPMAPDGYILHQIPHNISPMHCNALQTCTFILYLRDGMACSNEDLNSLPSLFQRLAAPALETITLQIQTPESDGAREGARPRIPRGIATTLQSLIMLDWELVEAALARDEYACVRHLVIEGCGDEALLAANILPAIGTSVSSPRGLLDAAPFVMFDSGPENPFLLRTLLPPLLNTRPASSYHPTMRHTLPAATPTLQPDSQEPDPTSPAFSSPTCYSPITPPPQRQGKQASPLTCSSVSYDGVRYSTPVRGSGKSMSPSPSVLPIGRPSPPPLRRPHTALPAGLGLLDLEKLAHAPSPAADASREERANRRRAVHFHSYAEFSEALRLNLAIQRPHAHVPTPQATTAASPGDPDGGGGGEGTEEDEEDSEADFSWEAVDPELDTHGRDAPDEPCASVRALAAAFPAPPKSTPEFPLSLASSFALGAPPDLPLPPTPPMRHIFADIEYHGGDSSGSIAHLQLSMAKLGAFDSDHRGACFFDDSDDEEGDEDVESEPESSESDEHCVDLSTIREEADSVHARSVLTESDRVAQISMPEADLLVPPGEHETRQANCISPATFARIGFKVCDSPTPGAVSTPGVDEPAAPVELLPKFDFEAHRHSRRRSASLAARTSPQRAGHAFPNTSISTAGHFSQGTQTDNMEKETRDAGVSTQPECHERPESPLRKSKSTPFIRRPVRQSQSLPMPPAFHMPNCAFPPQPQPQPAQHAYSSDDPRPRHFSQARLPLVAPELIPAPPPLPPPQPLNLPLTYSKNSRSSKSLPARSHNTSQASSAHTRTESTGSSPYASVDNSHAHSHAVLSPRTPPQENDGLASFMHITPEQSASRISRLWSRIGIGKEGKDGREGRDGGGKEGSGGTLRKERSMRWLRGSVIGPKGE
ncbi:hypothetical protein WOLCODRAFT_164690 [Wolfiporia cocos MD-104 SS10]|uniref:F-box domain-containing protein n=1 Tax=Wolfiporia cocos (strain MD-104) TaxID=742152 RepID=A0A2H3JNI8_WOLCO|nr:hypothetical protein WOLCODRAFT_164690 [Wolfiporia cocos MD-104 SS10]